MILGGRVTNMMHFACYINDLSYGKIMTVYEESNLNKARVQYSDLDNNVAIHMVEQEFYTYLKDVFFQTEGAYCAVFEKNNQYCCIVRIEPYLDGVILAGLETAPEFRRMGFASRLYLELLTTLTKPVYVHVEKKNYASILLHEKFGFSIIADFAVFLDGSRSEDAYTLCWSPIDNEISIDK